MDRWLRLEEYRRLPHNEHSRVRKIEVDKIDFNKGATLAHQPRDRAAKQDIEKVMRDGK
jgi:hypothetical protein